MRKAFPYHSFYVPTKSTRSMLNYNEMINSLLHVKQESACRAYSIPMLLCRISTHVSLKYIPMCPVNNGPASVHIMAWCRLGDMIMMIYNFILILRATLQYIISLVRFISHYIPCILFQVREAQYNIRS